MMHHFEFNLSDWQELALIALGSALFCWWSYVTRTTKKPPVIAARCNSVEHGSRCELEPEHECPHVTNLGKMHERWWALESPKDPT